MKILIIEDNISLVNTLKDVLENNNYEVSYFTDLDNIENYLILNSYDLIILDLMLGNYSGIEFLKYVREDINTPIIILTAKNTKEDIIRGFKVGADDYITKPFDMDILLARIRARINSNKGDFTVVYKDTEFDFEKFIISKSNKNEVKSLPLTSSEAYILKFLYRNKGIFMSKEKILDNIKNDFEASDRVIVSHIYNIRKKLIERKGDDPIENKWKVGYRWKEN